MAKCRHDADAHCDNLGYIKMFFRDHRNIIDLSVPKTERLIEMCEDLQQAIMDLDKSCKQLN